jgi:hypothetical protein
MNGFDPTTVVFHGHWVRVEDFNRLHESYMDAVEQLKPRSKYHVHERYRCEGACACSGLCKTCTVCGIELPEDFV